MDTQVVSASQSDDAVGVAQFPQVDTSQRPTAPDEDMRQQGKRMRAHEQEGPVRPTRSAASHHTFRCNVHDTIKCELKFKFLEFSASILQT